MLGEFLDSWALMRDAYTAAWIAAASLSVAGVVLLVRDQAFLGLAVAQASTFGLMYAPSLAHMLHADRTPLVTSHAFEILLAILFAVTTALVLESAGARAHHGRNAMLAYAFLATTGLSALLATRGPDSRDLLERLMTSSTLAAGPIHVAMLLIALIATTALIASSRRKLLLIALDPSMAAAVGLHIDSWSVLLASGFGATVGLSVPATGTLYAFACLVLPALAARNLCREIGTMFAVAPIIAVMTAIVGFVLAERFDVPPAPLTVALQTAAVAPAWLVGRLRRER